MPEKDPIAIVSGIANITPKDKEDAIKLIKHYQSYTTREFRDAARNYRLGVTIPMLLAKALKKHDTGMITKELDDLGLTLLPQDKTELDRLVVSRVNTRDALVKAGIKLHAGDLEKAEKNPTKKIKINKRQKNALINTAMFDETTINDYFEVKQ